MNSVQGFALLSIVATLLSPLVTSVSAEPATEAKPAAATEAKPAMSEADKRAKASDCSRQADAKKLHGEERKKFREACKRK